MRDFKLLAIYRHPQFSNNAIEADRLILEEAVKAFCRHFPRKVKVDFLEEAQINTNHEAYHLVLTMTQSAAALAELDKQKDLLPIVWNSTAAIRNCYRSTMSKKLENANVGYANFFTIRSWEEMEKIWEQGASYWIKRGDFHAINDEDVSLAETKEEAQIKINKILAKGVNELIVQKHIQGDIYKFYGVNGEFFTCIRVRKLLNNDQDFDLAFVRENCRRAAQLLGLQIYGGDFIVDQTGRAQLIDLNDWPSFRICREQAAEAIGRYASRFIVEAQNTNNVKVTQNIS